MGIYKSFEVVVKEKLSLNQWNPTIKPWKQTELRASDVLAGALEFWGAGGERWVQRTYGKTLESGCLYGGLYAAGFGDAEGGSSEHTHIVQKAETFVLDELEAKGYMRNIIAFNDKIAKDFSEVRAIACGALKRALAAEAIEDEKGSEPRRTGKHRS